LVFNVALKPNNVYVKFSSIRRIVVDKTRAGAMSARSVQSERSQGLRTLAMNGAGKSDGKSAISSQPVDSINTTSWVGNGRVANGDFFVMKNSQSVKTYAPELNAHKARTCRTLPRGPSVHGVAAAGLSVLGM
jgi:hypothetical protein